MFFWRGGGGGTPISLTAILKGIPISQVICVQGYTYHCDTGHTPIQPFQGYRFKLAGYSAGR